MHLRRELLERAVLIGIVAFALFSAAFLLVRRGQARLPDAHRSDDSSAAVRVAIAVISTLSALVLGLVLSSMKTNFDNVQRDVRRFGTELVMLDAALRHCGEAAGPARAEVLDYAKAALRGSWPEGGRQAPVVDDRTAAALLEKAERSVLSLSTTDPVSAYYAAHARASIGRLVALRGAIISENEAFLPPVFVVLLVSWFTLLFGGFGYRAPINGTVTASMLCAAFAVASAIALMTELDGAFTGLIVVSDTPLRNAIAILSGPG